MAQLPGSPEGASLSPRQVRYLKLSIVIMTALLILGIVALIYGMTREASRIGPASRRARAEAKAPYMYVLDMGRGEMKGIAGGNGLIIMQWRDETADTIVTIEAISGHEVGRIQVPRR